MKILVTDDSTGWIDYHVNVLNSLFDAETVIETAKSAKEGLEKITANIDEPYDIIFTDMQMESDFLPLYAGEWFIKQIKTYKEYENSRIIIISAAPNIKRIADKYNVEFLQKSMCQLKENYKNLLFA